MTFKEYLNEGNYKSKEDVIIDDFSDLSNDNFSGKEKINFTHKDGIAYVEGNMEIKNGKLIIKKGAKLVLPYNIKPNEIN